MKITEPGNDGATRRQGDVENVIAREAKQSLKVQNKKECIWMAEPGVGNADCSFMIGRIPQHFLLALHHNFPHPVEVGVLPCHSGCICVAKGLLGINSFQNVLDFQFGVLFS